MDEAFNQSDTTPDDADVAETIVIDIPDLPLEERMLIRYIMRHTGITDTQLRHNLAELSGQHAIDVDHVDELLRKLIKRGLVERLGSGEAVAYRAQLQRRAARKTTITGIWSALDFDETESAVNPEMRRVRSQLADRLLADLDQPIHISSELAAPQDDETQHNVGSLMGDLLSTGRTSMAKRDIPQPTESETSAEKSRRPDTNSLMDDLIAAGKGVAAEAEVEKALPKPPNESRQIGTRLFSDIPKEETSSSQAAELPEAAAITTPTPPPEDSVPAPTPAPAASVEDNQTTQPETLLDKILNFLGFKRLD